MVRTRQPGQTVFRSILREDNDGMPFPAFSALRYGQVLTCDDEGC
jgi:hypothetical protein